MPSRASRPNLRLITNHAPLQGPPQPRVTKPWPPGVLTREFRRALHHVIIAAAQIPASDPEPAWMGECRIVVRLIDQARASGSVDGAALRKLERHIVNGIFGTLGRNEVPLPEYLAELHHECR